MEILHRFKTATLPAVFLAEHHQAPPGFHTFIVAVGTLYKCMGRTEVFKRLRKSIDLISL